MSSFSPDQTLVLVALEMELPRGAAPDWNIQYTGVGKINAAMNAMKFVHQYDPAVIINYGSAGALRSDLNGLVEVNELHQRDMDVRPLGFALGQTPFEIHEPINLGRNGVSCGTGDTFVTANPELLTDIVDMEAYAIAKLSQQAGKQFYCYKFISDNADDGAAADWDVRLAEGARLFARTVLGI